MIEATNPVFYLILVNKALPVTAFCIPVLRWNEYQAGVWPPPSSYLLLRSIIFQ